MAGGNYKRPDRLFAYRVFPIVNCQFQNYSTILIGKALLAVMAATLIFAAIFCEIS